MKVLCYEYGLLCIKLQLESLWFTPILDVTLSLVFHISQKKIQNVSIGYRRNAKRHFVCHYIPSSNSSEVDLLFILSGVDAIDVDHLLLQDCWPCAKIWNLYHKDAVLVKSLACQAKLLSSISFVFTFWVRILTRDYFVPDPFLVDKMIIILALELVWRTWTDIFGLVPLKAERFTINIFVVYIYQETISVLFSCLRVSFCFFFVEKCWKTAMCSHERRIWNVNITNLNRSEID